MRSSRAPRPAGRLWRETPRGETHGYPDEVAWRPGDGDSAAVSSTVGRQHARVAGGDILILDIRHGSGRERGWSLSHRMHYAPVVGHFSVSVSAALGALALLAGSAHAAIVCLSVNQTETSLPIEFYYNPISQTPNVGHADKDAYLGHVSSTAIGNYYGGYSVTLSPFPFDTELDSSTVWGAAVGVNDGLINAYYGIRADAGGGNYNYGWAQVSTTLSSATLVQLAFETTANTAIKAGAGAVPEPSSLALVALAGGGAARLRTRKRRSA